MTGLLADSFYDSVLREIIFALGAALFLANARALYRRRADLEAVSQRTVARHRAGSPVRGYRREENRELLVAPFGRTLLYAVVGFVVMIAGLGAMINK